MTPTAASASRRAAPLQAAQSLYEDKKAITYPRTSSRFLSGDLVPELKPTAATLVPIGEYAAAARFVLGLEQLPLGRVVNDARVDDHHAIIPTNVDHDVHRFTPDERRIFDLVARRFLAVFHPPARFARTTIVTEVEGERFRTRGKVTLEPGWRGVYGLESDVDKAGQEDEGEAEGGELPKLEKGQKIRCVVAEAEAKETKPPPRYSEATLLSAMEGAGKLIDDEELREAMKESGLGTPATRAETIETLIRREYIERAGKELQPTPKGLQVITMLDEHKITSPELTGDWEKKLSDIEHGRFDRRAFMTEIEDFTRETVTKIAELDKEKLRPERVELGPCPRCGRDDPRELTRVRLHELEVEGGARLRVRDLEARRGPHDHPRGRAPAARGRPLARGAERLSVACRQTFPGPPRLERGRQGRVRFSGAGENRRARSRGIGGREPRSHDLQEKK